jgi:CheY-like chemotaxis protein
LETSTQRIDGGRPHRDARPSIRVLVVEDVAAEAELIIQQLRSGGLSCVWHRVETESEL